MSATDAIKVRRKTQRPFAMIPHDFAQDGSLSDKAFRLWIVLQSYADFDDKEACPYVSTLAAQMGCSRVTIWRAQTELVERGLLEIESGQSAGERNVYTVLDPVDNGEGYCIREIPPISPVKYKGNKNQLTRINNKSESEFLPVDILAEPEREAVPDRISDIRSSLRRKEAL